MKFTKNKGLSFAAITIVLVVFNVIAFVLPFERGATFWVGYSFTLFAILLTAGVGLLALGREGLKSKYYGVPIIFVAWSYLIIQAILSLIEMAMPFIPYPYPLVLNAILLGACLVGLIAVSMVKEEIEHIDAKVKKKTFYIKSIQVDLEGLVSCAKDDLLKKSLKNLVDTVKYSDPMSNPQLAAIEKQIEAIVPMLTESVNKADDSAKGLIDELQRLFTERNLKCKLLK